MKEKEQKEDKEEQIKRGERADGDVDDEKI